MRAGSGGDMKQLSLLQRGYTVPNVQKYGKIRETPL